MLRFRDLVEDRLHHLELIAVGLDRFDAGAGLQWVSRINHCNPVAMAHQRQLLVHARAPVGGLRRAPRRADGRESENREQANRSKSQNFSKCSDHRLFPPAHLSETCRALVFFRHDRGCAILAFFARVGNVYESGLDWGWIRGHPASARALRSSDTAYIYVV